MRCYTWAVACDLQSCVPTRLESLVSDTLFSDKGRQDDHVLLTSCFCLIVAGSSSHSDQCIIVGFIQRFDVLR